MLSSIQTENKAITYAGCLTQVYFFMVFICTDSLLLTIMAICHPLYVVMNPCLCGLRLLLSLFVSILNALIHSLMVLQLSFCTDLKIPHFCELAQILKLACSDTLINGILVYLATKLLRVGPLSGVIFSYTRIVSFIQRMPSIGERYKTFSTCGSHLSVIFLNYGTCVGIYLSSAATLSPRGGGQCDVHCDYSNDEPLHLQPEEQRHKDSLEEIHLQNVFFSMIVSSTFGVGF